MHTNIVALDARAVRTSLEIVDKLRAEDLVASTPCADWNLGELLAHMAAQHRGFAAAARGHGGDQAVWRNRPLGTDPAGGYRAAAEEVLAAFAEDGVLDREFLLPEIALQPFPAATAISFHTIDYVVHSWDVARALGVDVEFDHELLGVVGAGVARIPDGPARLRPGAAFRPGLTVPEGTGELDAILAAVGRSPQWPKEG
jgi:uncharacterized protein (TIGR03086 family)